MSESGLIIQDLKAALVQQAFPTITMWNRLEGRPRASNFDRALRAEVRDALWMLTKQWQLGEFKGDDAGSPVTGRIHVTSARLTKYEAARGTAQRFDDALPLEAVVERRPIPLRIGGRPVALDLRLAMGRQWLKLVSQVGNLAQAYIDRYPIAMPDPEDEGDAAICAHPAVWARFAAVAGRAMDGAALYEYLKSDATHHAYDGIPLPAHQQGEIDQAADKYVHWFESLFSQRTEVEGDAWEPACLEYQFACSAPEAGGDKVYTADEYYHGHLDWYNLDVDPDRASLGAVAGPEPPAPPPLKHAFIPAPISFEGMPDTRWWAFEDSRTNLGDIKPDTTDIAKLLLMEFGLVYANDWFLFPVTLPVGSIARVKGLAVTNVFGERTWIEPSGSGPDEAWQSWRMFTTSVKGSADVPAEMTILLLPTVPKIQEGSPLEAVMLIRDEVANMVWGVETTVPLADGTSKPGSEAAGELVATLQRLIDAGIAAGTIPEATTDTKASIRYRVMNAVPENWIPFIPVHVPGDSREIQLQRAAMPRILEGDPDPPEKVRPRTVLLREGLDRAPAEAYFVHEEEVPRAGVRVASSFQRTRWRDGRVVIWLGTRKGTGRGEGSSGLAFDQILPVD